MNIKPVLTICLAAASICGCRGEHSSPVASSPGDAAKAKPPAGDRAMAFRLTSSAFQAGAAIPRNHTGEGDDLSPPLAWDDVPQGAKQFALICDDPDAPTPEPWVHWVIYGIAADVRALPKAVPNEPQLTRPLAARQGKNSWDSGATIGYRGPMPPPGHGTHHYHFKLYALDQPLDLKPSASKAQLLAAIKGHVVGEAELIGTYERKK
jgi:Raf kinase inhibitor-like YbhB/YbcL family protein